MSFKEYYGNQDHLSVINKKTYLNTARELFLTPRKKQRTSSEWLKSTNGMDQEAKEESDFQQKLNALPEKIK